MKATSRLLLFFFLVAASWAQTNRETVQAAAEILHTNCFACHSSSLSQSGLRLDSQEAAVRGGTRGPAVVPGDAAASRLLRAVMHEGDLAMPPGRKLADEQIATLRRWIEQGAEWPGAAEETPGEKWWSLVPPQRPSPPETSDAWVSTPIDAFILAKLQEEDLSPSPEAEKLALLRRAYHDLHGLPPTPEQIDSF